MRSTLTLITLTVALFASAAHATAPSKMVIQNQFGETSINVLQGSVLPIAPSGNVIILAGATAPTNGGSGSGVNVAGKGSFYIAKDSGLAYQQTGLISSPTWVAMGSAGAGGLLTGYVAGAGVVAASDTILQGFNKVGGSVADLKNGKFTPTSETISAAGALSTTAMVSLINNASGAGYAVTLAAPSSQDGQLKIIKFGTATNPATLACTNIAFSGAYTPTGTTTLTFSISGQSAVFMAVGSKWVYLGGSAVAS